MLHISDSRLTFRLPTRSFTTGRLVRKKMKVVELVKALAESQSEPVDEKERAKALETQVQKAEDVVLEALDQSGSFNAKVRGQERK